MGLSVAPESDPTLRLALTLVLALALHGMAMYFLRYSPSSLVNERKAALEVVLRGVDELPSDGFPDTRQAVSIIGARVPAPRSAEPQPPADEGVQAMPSPVRESQPTISAAQLQESARRIIRAEVKNAERGGLAGNEHPPDAVEARLAKALRAPSVGEKHLDNYGLVKITTVSGSSYCLKAPPDGPRGGLVDPISIPTTCP